MDMLIRSGAIDIVVIDSVAALVPKAEIEGEMGDSHVGLQARLMSQALRKITGALNQSGTTAIFINQLREKIGVFFGSPETTTGGKALKFYASVRLDIRRIETLKEGTDAVGNRTRVKVVKNKMAPPFKQAEFDILYGVGISREGSLIDMGVEHGFVRKSGAWYTYEGDQLGQGKENARDVPQGQPGPGQRDRQEDQGEARHRRADRRTGRRPGRGRRLLSRRMTVTVRRRRRGRRGDRAALRGRGRQDAEPDQESVARAIALRLLTGAPRSRASSPRRWRARTCRGGRRAGARPVHRGRADRRRGVRADARPDPARRAGPVPPRASPSSCAARGSTTSWPARRSRRSTATTRRPPRGSSSRRKLAATVVAGRADARPPHLRGARPQGIPAGAGVPARARGARGARTRRTATTTSTGLDPDGRGPCLVSRRPEPTGSSARVAGPS